MRFTRVGFLMSVLRVAVATFLLVVVIWVVMLLYCPNVVGLLRIFGSLPTWLYPAMTVKEFDDVRWKDLRWHDFRKKSDLPPTLYFNSATIWPKANRLPAGFDPEGALRGAMNPGLGVRELHAEGITGKGVSVAIIDQALHQDHPEYKGKIVAYFGDDGWSMHGPAVASLLAGTNCGTAPEVRVYYAATSFGTYDAADQAHALDWIIRQNVALPSAEKIRVVSVSAGPSHPPFKNCKMWIDARERAEKAGILVLDGDAFVGACYHDLADPENPASCIPGFPGIPQPGKLNTQSVLAPCSPRTTAEEDAEGNFSYQYTGRGGDSWSMPYAAGVLAMGWQLRPDLSVGEMRDLLLKSAYTLGDGWKIINPKKFIRMVREAKPSSRRTEEEAGPDDPKQLQKDTRSHPEF